jgi:hypothetical protein
MISWIHVLAQFTPEALIIEAGGIFILICAYTAFWILRKRKYGSIETDLPSGPVKAYLNELIFSAEQLRAQLFGLNASKDAPHFTSKNHPPMGISAGHGLSAGTSSTGIPSDAQSQIELLQLKINDQAQQINTLTQEKTEADQKVGTSGGADAEAFKQLQARAAELESKLQEYSVIEDDLVNLSKLMRENKEMKAKLEQQPGSSSAGATPPQSPAASVAPDPVADEVVKELSALKETVDATTAAAEVAPPIAEASPPAPAQKVDTQPAAPIPAEPAASVPAQAAPGSGATTEQATPSQAAAPASPEASPDTDLVEEFEKMLNA